MIIRLSDVPPEGREFTGEAPSGMLELGDDPDVEAAGPVRYALKAVHIPNALLVSGELAVPMVFHCSRCDAPFQRTVSVSDFESSWELSPEPGVAPQPLDPESDVQSSPAAGDVESVDLTPEMREAIIIGFPAYPVCRPDCRGLCYRCGKNLNEGPCMCRPPDDHRWSMLDGLDIS